MPEKKVKPKKKPSRKLSQKERFIEAAREAEADETGSMFNFAIGKILTSFKNDKSPKDT